MTFWQVKNPIPFCTGAAHLFHWYNQEGLWYKVVSSCIVYSNWVCLVLCLYLLFRSSPTSCWRRNTSPLSPRGGCWETLTCFCPTTASDDSFPPTWERTSIRIKSEKCVDVPALCKFSHWHHLVAWVVITVKAKSLQMTMALTAIPWLDWCPLYHDWCPTYEKS